MEIFRSAESSIKAKIKCKMKLKKFFSLFFQPSTCHRWSFLQCQVVIYVCVYKLANPQFHIRTQKNK